MNERQEELQSQEDENANPYNMEKSWHKSQDGKPIDTADSLFYSSSQATRTNAAPVDTKDEEKKPSKKSKIDIYFQRNLSNNFNLVTLASHSM